MSEGKVLIAMGYDVDDFPPLDVVNSDGEQYENAIVFGDSGC